MKKLCSDIKAPVNEAYIKPAKCPAPPLTLKLVTKKVVHQVHHHIEYDPHTGIPIPPKLNLPPVPSWEEMIKLTKEKEDMFKK